MLRAFVALAFEPRVRNALTRVMSLQQEQAWARHVRWVPPENLHLTLRFLGDIALPEVPRVLAALEAALRDSEPFGFGLSGLSLFPTAARPRVVAVGIDEPARLIELAARIEAAVVSTGHPADARPFRPHITLGRFRRGKWRGVELAGSIEQVSVVVSEIVLIQSTLDPAGAQYARIGRVAL